MPTDPQRVPQNVHEGARESGSDTYKTLTTIEPEGGEEGMLARLRLATDAANELGQLRAEIERMTNHIHDLTGDGTGWWECACGYRVSSNFDQRIAGLERELGRVQGDAATLADKCVTFDMQRMAAEERTKLALTAKNYWMDRALKAEGHPLEPGAAS